MTGASLRIVPFVSVWDNGVEIETSATVDLVTGEVIDIEMAKLHQEQLESLEVLRGQYILLDDRKYDVEEDYKGFDYGAILKEA